MAFGNVPSPGVLPQQQQKPQQGGFLNSIGNLINNPFLMNLLAQQGGTLPAMTGTIGPGPLGSVGRAFLATKQQEQQAGLSSAREDLLRAQAGLARRKEETGGNLTAGNVQSTFEGDNGNMFIISRNGKVKDTGIKFSNNLQLVEQADGTVLAIDRRTGQSVGTPVTPEQAAGASTRKSQTAAAQTLPADLAGLDSTINNADTTIQKIKEVLPLIKPSTVGIESRLRGDLPGALGGEARTLKRQVNSLQANFGFDTLQKMRAASKTGGALGQVSERELDLLVNALRSIDLEGDVDVLRENMQSVITHYNNYKKEIEVMKNALREQAGQPKEKPQESNVIDFNDLPLG